MDHSAASDSTTDDEALRTAYSRVRLMRYLLLVAALVVVASPFILSRTHVPSPTWRAKVQGVEDDRWSQMETSPYAYCDYCEEEDADCDIDCDQKFPGRYDR